MTNTYTTVQKFSQWKFVNIKKKVSYGNPRLHLLDRKNSKKKQSEASVMGSFRNHSNALIWCSIHFCTFFCGYHEKIILGSFDE